MELNIRNYLKKPPLPNRKKTSQNISSEQLISSKATDQKNQSLILPKIAKIAKIFIHSRSIQKLKDFNDYQNKSEKSLIPSNRQRGQSAKLSEKSNQRISSKNSSDAQQAEYQNHFVPKVSANSWIVYQMKKKKFIYGKRIFKKRQIASLTKIMNLITTLQTLNRCQLDPKRLRIKISRQATQMIGTTAFLKEGMQLSIYDLFFGMMLPSGNDAAYVIAQVIGTVISLENNCKLNLQIIYNIESFSSLYMSKKNSVCIFVNQMNRMAKSLCMYNTYFGNPHGLSQTNSLSTVQDLSKLCTFCMQNEMFKKIVNTKAYKFNYNYNHIKTIQITNQNGQLQTYLQENYQKCNMQWQNTNKLLWQGWNGIKTGITPNAGPCLAASFVKIIGGCQYNFLVVLINSSSMQIRWKEAKQIVNWVLSQKIY